MKPIFLINAFIGIATALAFDRAPRRAGPGSVPDSTLSAPAGAPADFTISYEILAPDVAQDTSGLQPVPRHVAALRVLKREDPGDFYECSTTTPQPKASDCAAVLSTVSASNQPLILAQYACVLYSSGTCRAFYCSLCGTLETSTDFLVNQLNVLQGVCLPSGRGGAVVAEGGGGWQAGFGHVNGTLPFYDICGE